MDDNEEKKLNLMIEDQNWHQKINDRPLFNPGENQTWKSREWEKRKKIRSLKPNQTSSTYT